MSRQSPERQAERDLWLAKAADLAPLLAETAAQSAQARTLHPAAVDALAAAGFFAFASPLEVGGFDVHPATQVECFETLARADLSGAWVAMIQAETPGLAASHLPAGEGVEAVFGASFPRVAGTANPEGTAQAHADGSFTFRGRWSFASGIRHCGWVLANAIVVDADGNRPARGSGLPPVIGGVIPTSSLTIEDSWHVIGLQGTGSCHYQMDGVRVTPPFLTPFGGTHAERGGAWFENPTITFLSPGHTGVALGAAARALELLQGDLTQRVRMGAGRAIADRPAFQRDFGQRHSQYQAVRAYALHTLDEALARREAGEPTTPAQDAEIRSMVTYVTDAALEIVQFAQHHAGGAAAFQSHPIQQLYRDLTVAAQHIFVADSAYERHGAYQLNRQPQSVM